MKAARVGGARARALLVIGRLQPVEPLTFARAMWPRARGWDRPHIMVWAARSFLARMQKAKLVSPTDLGFLLTNKGFALRDELPG
jgi:hypothetical protein